MEFIKKLDFLMDERHVKKHKFADDTDIPYTTVCGWYKKGTEQIKRSYLLKIANYFGVTLDFVMDDEIDISDLKNHRVICEGKVDSDIFQKYSTLNESAKAQVNQFIDFLGNQSINSFNLTPSETKNAENFVQTAKSEVLNDYIDSIDNELL